jgi:hypothetical protein
MTGRIERPGWLQVCRHRIRGVTAPYLLILQHDFIQNQSRIAAPVLPAGRQRANLLMPRLTVEGSPHEAIMLEMASVPLGRFGVTVASSVDQEAVSDALDAIFRGYPVGLS